jgi:hypothetical protein
MSSGEYSFLNRGTFNTDDGNDTIICQGRFLNADAIFLGDDNDSIIVTIFKREYFDDRVFNALDNAGFIDTGDGDDIITSTSIIYNSGFIDTGNGNDSIIANAGFDSNSSRAGSVFLGDGDDTITSTGVIYDWGSINTGNGNDYIIANAGFGSDLNNSNNVFLGEGEDYIKGFGSGDFYGGNGNDTLELTPGTYTVGIWGEAGESPIFTQGNQLMITSEFEKLRAGNTLYDFTSLTAGQIITVA